MKKRTITRSSLEALAKELKPLSECEQGHCVGGGTGTEQDPYTYAEYQQHIASGTWTGGFVAGGTDTYTRDDSGNWRRSSITDSIYIGAKDHMLEEVIVTGSWPRTKHNPTPWMDNYDGPSGSYDSEQERYRDGSGFWYYADPDKNQSQDGGGGGGFFGTKPVVMPWDKAMSFLEGYGVALLKSNYADADIQLGQVLEKLSQSKVFGTFLDAICANGLILEVKAAEVVASSSSKIRYGETVYTPPGTKPIEERISLKLLENGWPVGVAATVVHETIHASLLGAFGFFGINVNEIKTPGNESYDKFNSAEFKERYPKIHDYFSRYTLEEAEHEYMAEHYRPLIIQALKDAYPEHEYEVYEALSWSGLERTSLWEKLKQEDQDEYRRIWATYKSTKGYGA